MPAVALSRTNYQVRSQDLADPAWTKARCTATSNTADVVAPDGTNTASKIVEDNTAAQTHFWQAASPFVVRAGEAFGISWYLRGGGAFGTTRRLYVQTNDGTGLRFGCFNPRTGLIDVVPSGNQGMVLEMLPAPNGWYRCSVVVSTIAAGQEATAAQFFWELDAGADAAAITNVYNGDNASGLYLWGIQAVLCGPTSGPPEYVATAGVQAIGNPRFLIR